MSVNEKKVPKRRFKEFQNADAWEQRKLTEEVELYSGLTYSPNDVVKEGGTLVLRSSNVKNGEVVDADNVYVNSEVVNSNNVNKGDIIIVVRNGSRSLIGKHGQIKSEMKNTVIGAFMTGMRSTNSDFTNALLSTSSFYKEIEENLGATINQITNGMFQNMHFMFPSGAEQTKIGEYFTKLDNLITLHQRKLDKLKALKKAYLTDMFPAEGESKPKLRFAGFTDDWEQRKLGEVASYRRGSFPQPYGKSEWYDGEDAKPFVQVADVTDAMNLVDDTKQKISKLAQPMSVFAEENSVLVTLQGSIGRVAITQYGAFIDRTVLIFEKYKTEIDTLFWSYVIKQKFIEEARKAPGGTIKTITKEALSDFDLLLPTYEEQQKIGVYFKQLDNLITLHQRKLEKLQNIKKAYLNEMFV
ncbi:restriction endonuclease subunit S [Clostridium bornimense]|uniref:restriction endonuclease subunit S n=1 Tax=Clostridium bornimense TaxID=1216932 RepID=UPI001C129512|nr:restriction endonuclease subunit S [Clostridium bornimense]MBU5317599.1 restriction endonuclease subunit S [Clostridium bornimense]